MADYFVDSTNGDNSNNGSFITPVKNISVGIKLLRAGDNLYIRSGLYQEYIESYRSGTLNLPITIQPYKNEEVIVDGSNYTIPDSSHDALIHIGGNYITIKDIYIQYSSKSGVISYGSYNQFLNLNISYCFSMGIGILGDHNVNNRVYMCTVHDCCQNNADGNFGRDHNSVAITAMRHPIGCIIENNTVYQNYGEGISSVEANTTIIRNNVVHDSWNQNLYLSNTPNGVIDNNVSYSSGTMASSLAGKTAFEYGIVFGDEQPESVSPINTNLSITNNIVEDGYQNLKFSSASNSRVTHNTFKNGKHQSCIASYGGIHSVLFESNIIIQYDILPVFYAKDYTGLSFSKNIWSKKPPKQAIGIGDIIIPK